MKYFIYARKSTEEEDRQILSIEAQLVELKEFAAKEKLEIVASFQEAKTAKEPGRIIFGEILARIEKGEANGIISWHPDRLARNSVDGGKIIHMIDKRAITALKFPTFWFEPTPQGLFMLSIAFGQSKYYIDNLRENVKRGMRQKLRNGVWPSLAPIGYLNNPKTRGIDIDPVKTQKPYYFCGLSELIRIGSPYLGNNRPFLFGKIQSSKRTGIEDKFLRLRSCVHDSVDIGKFRKKNVRPPETYHHSSEYRIGHVLHRSQAEKRPGRFYPKIINHRLQF